MAWTVENWHTNYADMTKLALDLAKVSAQIEQVAKLAGGKELDQMRATALVLNVLEQDVWQQELSLKQRRELHATVIDLCRVANITPYKSKLDFIYLALHLHGAHGHLLRGEIDAAFALLMAAPQWTKNPLAGQRQLYDDLQMRIAARQGHGLLVRAALERHNTLAAAWLPVLLLRADVARQKQLLASLDQTERQWWQAMQAAQTGQLQPMMTALRPDSPLRHPHRLLTGKLWAYAVRSKQHLQTLPKTETIRRQFAQQWKKDQAGRNLFDAVAALEACYDFDVPLHIRLQRLPEVASLASQVPRLDQELLIILAIVRFAVRSRQNVVAATYLDLYHSRSLALTEGQSRDCLQAASDLETLPAVQQPFGATAPAAQPLATGTWQRRWLLASTVASSAGMWLLGQTKNRLRDQAQLARRNQQLFDEIAYRLIQGLGPLRGVAMKLGQMIEVLQPLRPERETTLTMVTPAPSLDPAAANQLVKAELGQEPAALFAEWRAEPVAVASIGQVHRAMLADGQDVAVKLQDPAISGTLVSDLDHLHLIRPLLQQIYPRIDFHGVVDELKQRFGDECDYQLEAQWHGQFRELWQGENYITIPKVIASHSSRHILTTQWLEGEHLADILPQLDQAQKDQYGQWLYRFFVRSLLKGRLIYSDPNPGNILFREHGLGILDFGLILPASDDLLMAIEHWFESAVHHDRDRFKQGVDAIGMAAHAKNYDYATHFDVFIATTGSPWASAEPFQFSPEFFRREVEANVLVNPFGRHVSIDKRHLLLMRAYLAIVSILCQLEATGPWQQIIQEERALAPLPAAGDVA